MRGVSKRRIPPVDAGGGLCLKRKCGRKHQSFGGFCCLKVGCGLDIRLKLAFQTPKSTENVDSISKNPPQKTDSASIICVRIRPLDITYRLHPLADSAVQSDLKSDAQPR
uniref:Uncharacterized protein n=1 Tax=Romanomermis culicivorax TaxID=13658 RepID=A0A915IPN9_ROMCU